MIELPMRAAERKAIAQHRDEIADSENVERRIRAAGLDDLSIQAFIDRWDRPVINVFLTTTTMINCHPESGLLRFYMSALRTEQKEFDRSKAFASWALKKRAEQQAKLKPSRRRPLDAIFEPMMEAPDMTWLRHVA